MGRHCSVFRCPCRKPGHRASQNHYAYARVLDSLVVAPGRRQRILEAPGSTLLPLPENMPQNYQPLT